MSASMVEHRAAETLSSDTSVSGADAIGRSASNPESPHVSDEQASPDEHDEEYEEEERRPMLSSASSSDRPATGVAPNDATPKKDKKRRSPPRPRWKVILTYVPLATTAVGLTVACQDTVLWNYTPLATSAGTSAPSSPASASASPSSSEPSHDSDPNLVAASTPTNQRADHHGKEVKEGKHNKIPKH